MIFFTESSKWAWENQNEISGIRETKNGVTRPTRWFRQRGKISPLHSSVFVVFVLSLLLGGPLAVL